MTPSSGGQSLVYLEVARLVEDRILRGIYREGQVVASTNELANDLKINPATAARGLNRLVAEGILEVHRGIGMFVVPGGAEKIRSARREAFLDTYVRPLVREGRSLGLDETQLLEMVAQAIREGETT